MSDRLYALLSELLPKYNGMVFSDEDYDIAHGRAMLAYADIEKLCQDFLYGFKAVMLNTHYSLRPTYDLISLNPPTFEVGFELMLDDLSLGNLEGYCLNTDCLGVLIKGGTLCFALKAGEDTSESLRTLSRYAMSEVEDEVILRKYYKSIKRRG